MNRLLISIAAFALCLGSCATLTPEQKAAKERQKLEEARQDSIANATAVTSLEKMDFVLEADKLVFKRGRPAYVSSSTNFISSGDGRTTVQVAPFNSGGPNGVGGVTVEGIASSIKTTREKNGTFIMSFNVTGTAISAAVTITIPAGTNRASALISPNFNSDRITLEGPVVPAHKSGVYKGRAL